MGVFVRPNPETLNWVSHTNYPLEDVVQTRAEDMSIHLARHCGNQFLHIQLLTLRQDGLSSVNAPYDGEELPHKALEISGKPSGDK